LGSVDDDLLTQTDLATGLVVRRIGNGFEIEVLGLKLGDAIANPGGESDLVLQPQDEILIFAQPYVNKSYRDEVASAEEEVADGFGEQTRSRRASGQLNERWTDVEDRSELIQEVVFRLQAQAKDAKSTRIVEIAGEVRSPGRYPLLPKSDIEALVSLAGGYKTSAFLESAEISRLRFTGEGAADVVNIAVPLHQSAADNSFQLKPLDRVRIRQIPNWSYGDAVQVTGAVAFPGTFPIFPGEKLSSVLARAGGVEENGFPQGAVLIKAEAQKR